MLDFAPVMTSVAATGRAVITQCAVTDRQALEFGTLTEVRQRVPFHHDPNHTDTDLDR